MRRQVQVIKTMIGGKWFIELPVDDFVDMCMDLLSLHGAKEDDRDFLLLEFQTTRFIKRKRLRLKKKKVLLRTIHVITELYMSPTNSSEEKEMCMRHLCD